MTPCRLFPFEKATGAANMARDEALLDLVAADPSAAVFRVYGWAEPTLSLGYFQSIQLAEADDRWRDVARVRRPTGGGALWHDHELTYAIVVPRSHELARQTRVLYRTVHAAIAGLLRDAGLEAGPRGEVVPGGNPPFLCFADRDADDVVAGPVKLVGSAQRRRAGAVLQHGSILLQRSSRTPELPGVCDLAESGLNLETWTRGVADRVPQSLGFSVEPQEWPVAVLARAAELEREVYLHPKWTHRR